MEQKEIEKLLQSGFDLELISFEFDIPIEKVREYKENINNSKEDTMTTDDILHQGSYYPHLKMEQIRKRYKELASISDSPKQLELSPEQKVFIETTISKIEENIATINSLPFKEKRMKVEEILNYLSKIENYPLSVEQAEKLNILIHSIEYKNISRLHTDSINNEIKKARIKIASKLVKSIETEVAQVNEIEKLQEFYKRIMSVMKKMNYLEMESL